MKLILRELKNLADKWHREALAQVPPEYASRGLHDKYLRMDVEAAGLVSCADELRELLVGFAQDDEVTK